MAEAELLAKVKLALGETSDFADSMIAIYIDEVLDYMKNAGVSDSIANVSAGVVARGVSDLWDNDGGNVRFSPYFHERVTQLALKSRSDST
ncbi:MAG: hypothetical protein K2H29_10365 [Oscillospiraceae bacterium]|nr:hypothetical protein [Oscillospiraceae bacterium]